MLERKLHHSSTTHWVKITELVNNSLFHLLSKNASRVHHYHESKFHNPTSEIYKKKKITTYSQVEQIIIYFLKIQENFAFDALAVQKDGSH